MKPAQKEAPQIGLTPSSGYLLYGRGSREDYEREVLRVKNELRSELYVEQEIQEDKKRSDKGTKQIEREKKGNIAAIVLFVAAIVEIALAAVFAVLIKTYLISGIDLTRAIIEFVKRLGNGVYDMTFGVGICSIVGVLFCLTTMIGAACSVKRATLGKLMLTGVILWTAAFAVLCVLTMIERSVIPVEAVLLTIIAAIALVPTAIGGKKSGGK